MQKCAVVLDKEQLLLGAAGWLWSGGETLAIFGRKVGAVVRKLHFDKSGVPPYYLGDEESSVELPIHFLWLSGSAVSGEHIASGREGVSASDAWR